MHRRRGGERAAAVACAHVADAQRSADFEHRLSLRLSKQRQLHPRLRAPVRHDADRYAAPRRGARRIGRRGIFILAGTPYSRSEEHTSELQSLMRISYAVFCLEKKILPIQTRARTST